MSEAIHYDRRRFIGTAVTAVAGAGLIEAAVALLVLATISDTMWGVVYLVVFGIGTVAGMMLITAAISVPFAYTSQRLTGFNRSLGFASALSSLIFGMLLIYQIALLDGLFTG